MQSLRSQSDDSVLKNITPRLCSCNVTHTFLCKKEVIYVSITAYFILCKEALDKVNAILAFKEF